MSKHTPLTYIAHQDGYFLVKRGHKSGDNKIGEIYSQDNIEQIVSRVNLHDDLVEALEHMRSCACCADGDWNNCKGGRKAEAVLKKAKGTK